MSREVHIARARARLQDRARVKAQAWEALRYQAEQEARAIVALAAQRYGAARVYQWGSVLRPGGFREYSDIDLAVEGVTEPQAFFALLGEAQGLTRFPLDLVQMERLPPEHAADIRRHGTIVYERG